MHNDKSTTNTARMELAVLSLRTTTTLGGAVSCSVVIPVLSPVAVVVVIVVVIAAVVVVVVVVPAAVVPVVVVPAAVVPVVVVPAAVVPVVVIPAVVSALLVAEAETCVVCAAVVTYKLKGGPSSKPVLLVNALAITL